MGLNRVTSLFWDLSSLPSTQTLPRCSSKTWESHSVGLRYEFEKQICLYLMKPAFEGCIMVTVLSKYLTGLSSHSSVRPAPFSMYHPRSYHTMDLLWEKFQWILPLYMKPISFQSKASVVCSVTAAIFIGFCLKKLNVFSQYIGKKKTNEYLNSAEQIHRNWIVDQLSVLITSRDII